MALLTIGFVSLLHLVADLDVLVRTVTGLHLIPSGELRIGWLTFVPFIYIATFTVLSSQLEPHFWFLGSSAAMVSALAQRGSPLHCY